MNSYDAIFSNILVLFACQLSLVQSLQLVLTGYRLVETGFTQSSHYSQEIMIFCIRLSIFIPIETNKCLHYLARASYDSGLFGTIFLFHEW